MIHFIPYWKEANDRDFLILSRPWYYFDYRKFNYYMRYIELFYNNDVSKYQIVFLDYIPRIKKVLHYYNLLNAPYWSCFDCIQNIDNQTDKILTFCDLSWPDKIEFFYTNFCVVAYLEEEKYAEIQFDDEGSFFEIDMFEENQICCKKFYDERGFLSMEQRLEKGRIQKEIYYSDTGVWRICCYTDGHVEVNPKNNMYSIVYQNKRRTYQMKALSYRNISELINEVFSSYLELYKLDKFCVSFEWINYFKMDKILFDNKIILATKNQNIESLNKDYKKLKEKGISILVDDNQGLEINENIVPILPYYTFREKKENVSITNNIFFNIDNLPNPILISSLNRLKKFIQSKNRLQVILYSRSRNSNSLLEYISKNLSISIEKRNNKDDFNFDKKSDNSFYFVECLEENNFIECLKNQGLCIDLSSSPGLYTQVYCVDMGIPQFSMKQTNYIEHKKNGYIIEDDLSNFEDALHYFLDGLKQRNLAKIYCHKLQEQFEVSVLKEKWKKLLRE